jgi:HEAT repeat protein
MAGIEIRLIDAKMRLNMKNTGRIDEFIDELKHGSQFARGNAAFVLGKMGKQAVPALIDALNSEHIEARRYAAYALGRIGDSTAVPALTHALRDVHQGVAKWAANALKAIGA